MTETELLEEASYAWDDGRRSEALQLLKFAVRQDPSRLTVRRALAERYREMGHPDQAGRWGIVFDGWTTDFERDRLARLLAASRVSEAQTPQFLALDQHEFPEVVLGLVSGSVETYRSKFENSAQDRRKSAQDRYENEKTDRFDVAALAASTWGFFVVACVVSAFVTLGFAVFGSVGRVETRTGVLFLVGILSYALFWNAVLAINHKSKAWAISWGLAATAAAFVTMLYGVNGWIYR
jgi:hypothetical protein